MLSSTQSSLNNDYLIEDNLEQIPLPRSNFPKIDLNSISPSQKYYLDMLSKYSPKANRFKVVQSKDMPLRKEAFIKDNLSYLSINEQVAFNDCTLQLKKDYDNSHLIAIAVFFGALTVYAIKTPLTRSLGKESAKSLGIAIGGGYIYYKYNHSLFLDRIHKFYVLIIQEKTRKRENREVETF